MVTGDRLTFVFDQANRPGVYQFDLTRRPDGAGAPLRERLEAIADELMVDLDLADPVTA